MSTSLLDQGLNLMIYGMGTVFVFLTLLVFATKAMSMTILRFFPSETVEIKPLQPTAAAGLQTVDAKTVMIIQDAIHQHRAKHQP